MTRWLSLLRVFWFVDVQPLSRAERWRSSLGGFLFIGSAGLLLMHFPVGERTLLASVGASAVILYAQPHSPAAAPWSLVGGYLASTVSAVASLLLIPYPPLTVAFAVGGSIWLMARFKCVHPPGGSLALLIALAAPHQWLDYRNLGVAIAANTLLAVGLALLINRGILRRSYPQMPAPYPASKSSPTPAPRTVLLHEDLDYAFRQVDTFVDVDETELVTLFDLAVNHAYQRHQQLVCRDLMTSNPVRVQATASLNQAWSLLQLQRCCALPVVDNAGHFVGLLPQQAFLDALSDIHYQSVPTMIRQWLTEGSPNGQPQRVADLLITAVANAQENTPLAELMTLWAEHPSLPVTVLNEQQVVGIVSRSDLIRALYRERALGFSPPI